MTGASEYPRWDGVDLSGRPLLRDVAPEIADELAEAILQDGEHPGLADTVDELRIDRACGCGEWFCRSVYTIPPDRAQGGEPDWIRGEGMLYGAVLDGLRITEIEILLPGSGGRDPARKGALGRRLRALVAGLRGRGGPAADG